MQAITNIATYLARTDDVANAQTYADQAYQLNREVYGDDHPQTIHAKGNVVFAVAASGDHDKAATQCSELLHRTIALYGHQHPTVNHLRTSLAHIYGRGYGEGVSGLRQAFHLAGAKSVIGTSWSVLERESAILMLMFFKQLATTKDKALALQRAQVEMIEQLRKHRGAAHPLYWGAFSISYR